jgi:hypothetical protein
VICNGIVVCSSIKTTYHTKTYLRVGKFLHNFVGTLEEKRPLGRWEDNIEVLHKGKCEGFDWINLA